MLTSLNKTKNKLYAFDTEKTMGPFFCPHCNEEVILKKGEIKEPHFSHKSNSNCYTTNESEEHKLIKISIYKSLSKYSFISNLEMEKHLGNCISDVYFEKNNKKIAVEIQLSHLERHVIEERTMKYKEKGIHVIWVHSYTSFLERIDLSKREISLRGWEKWLTAMNYGYLFLWKKEDMIIPVKTSSIPRENNMYFKNKKRIKSVELTSIARDMFPIEKEKWNNFPSAKLLFFSKTRK